MNAESGFLLIVDDEKSARDMLSRQLKRRGYEVLTAASGRQALELMKQHAFDLVLLDIMMPGMNGLEVLRILRETHSRGELPAIMVTAKGDPENIAEALGLGANDYVAKPMVFPVLLARIQIQLSLKRKEMELREAQDRLAARVAERTAELKMANEQLQEEIAERRRAEAELRFNNMVLSTQQETSLDGILVVDSEGKMLSFNQRFVDMWDIPADVAASGSDARALQVVLDSVADPEQFLSRVKYLYDHPDEKSREDVHLAGGRIFDRYSAPMLGPDGDNMGRIWYFRDITERRRAEERLTKLSNTVRQTADAVMITNKDGVIEYVNPAFEQLTGYSQEEVLGRTPNFLQSGKHVEAFYKNLWETILSGQVYHATLINRRQDGELYYSEKTITPINDAQGTVTHFISTDRDITEQREAQEALRESEKKLRQQVRQQEALLQINQAVQEMAQALDLERVIRVGLRALNHIGLNLQAMAVHRILDPEQRLVETFRACEKRTIAVSELRKSSALVACWRTGSMFYEEDIEKGDPEEVALLRERFGGLPIRSLLDVSFSRGVISAHSIDLRAFSEADEEVLKQVGDILAVGISRVEDLERLDARNQALRESEERLQGLVAYLPDGVCLLDAAYRLVLANPSAGAYLSVLTDAKVGDTLTHIGENALEDITASYKAEAPCRCEAFLEGPPLRIFDVAMNPIAESVAGEGWVLVIREVTQEREAQAKMQQQDRLAAVGQLAAGIAHDFNNLLTVVMGIAQLMEMRSDIPDTLKDDLKDIFLQGQRGAQLVRQILDVSRESVEQRRPMDLAPFLKETLKLLERTLREDIQIELEIDADEYVVDGNPTQFQQMLTNLAVNAQDAMPEGGGMRVGLSKLRLAPGETPPVPDMEAGEWVMLAVSDTGIGMSSELMQHIFDPFFTTKARHEGTGLGLAQVYGIVKQHEGEVTVESEETKGTVFTIYMPLASAQAQPEDQAEEDLSEGHGEMILVVEDEFEVRNVVRRLLERLGYRVLTASNGVEALELYDDHTVDLVLSDMVMPQMGGGEMFKALKAKDPGLRFVAMTGYIPGGRNASLFPEDIAGILQKPVKTEALTHVVKKALEGKAN